MIVRISGEAQYELPDEDAERLSELDNQAVVATEAGDEATFQQHWNAMLDLVTRDGTELGEDELVHSDVILPPRDIAFAEAVAGFSGDGLIPG